MTDHNHAICSNVCDFAINKYLRDGENKNALLKEYNNSNVELAVFLREREFAEFEKGKPKAKSKAKKAEPVKELKIKRIEPEKESKTKKNAPAKKKNEIPVKNYADCSRTGDNGAKLLAELFPEKFKLTDGYKGDLSYGNNLTLELKTDVFPKKTGNFFFEETSNTMKNTKGGVWQAKEHGCTSFGFYMVHYDRLYVSNVDKTLAWLEEKKNNYKLKESKKHPTEQYKTTGYKIPTKDIGHLFKEVILSDTAGYKELKLKYFPNESEPTLF